MEQMEQLDKLHDLLFQLGVLDRQQSEILAEQTMLVDALRARCGHGYIANRADTESSTGRNTMDQMEQLHDLVLQSWHLGRPQAVILAEQAKIIDVLKTQLVQT